MRRTRGATARAATIADVAKAAGCSTAVVSCVLNGARGNIRVGAATRERVRTAARALSYRPSFASRSLVLRRSHTLGVYVPPWPGASLGFTYESTLLIGVEAACREAGYDILAINLGGQHTPEVCAHKLAERRIDGLILFHVAHDVDWVDPLGREHANVAAVNYYGPCRTIDVIRFDDTAAVSMAVEHLARMGHRHIAYLDTLYPGNGPGEALRRTGFAAAMRHMGLTARDAWILAEDHPTRLAAFELPEPERMGHIGRWVLAQPPYERPTAWITHDDTIAVPLVKFMTRNGIAVPADVSVVGIDDSNICRYSDPELTSIRQPLIRMGHWAARRVIARATPSAPPLPCVLELAEPEWIERGSAAPPRVQQGQGTIRQTASPAAIAG